MKNLSTPIECAEFECRKKAVAVVYPYIGSVQIIRTDRPRMVMDADRTFCLEHVGTTVESAIKAEYKLAWEELMNVFIDGADLQAVGRALLAKHETL